MLATMTNFDWGWLVPLITALIGYLVQSPRGQTVQKIIQTLVPGIELEDEQKAIRVLATVKGKAGFLAWLREYEEA